MEMYKRIFCLMIAAGILMLLSVANSQVKVSENIRLNQIGFYPSAPKVAVVVGATDERFFVLSENYKDTLFQGFMKKGSPWEYSGENISCR
jgi:endoglucanase